MAAAVKRFFQEQELFLNEPLSSMWFQIGTAVLLLR
jgi:hypothetical protein